MKHPGTKHLITSAHPPHPQRQTPARRRDRASVVIWHLHLVFDARRFRSFVRGFVIGRGRRRSW